MDDLKEKRKYWNLKKEALNHTLWRTCCGKSQGRVTRQTMQRINDLDWLRKQPYKSHLNLVNSVAMIPHSDARKY